MSWNKNTVLLIILFLAVSGCFRYSFSGTTIPEGINTIFIPFFPDQSNSGLGDLSDRLNQTLVNRFINESKLRLANSEAEADAILEGFIVSYVNRPFSISGEEIATRNQVEIRVSATLVFKTKPEPVWSKNFNGNSTYDPNVNPINGEREASTEALVQLANAMFNDALSTW